MSNCDLVMLTILVLICHLKTIITVVYNTNNVIDIFQMFKEKYNKKYVNDEEENVRLNNFIANLNKVSDLNEAELDKNTFYIINQYADLDPREIDEHYAIQIKPYFKVNNVEAEYAGRQKNKEVNTSELYDLDNAEELYKEYVKRFNKTSYKKKVNRQIHFYRFVKTLVELNNNYIKNNDNVTLDVNADVIREPNEFFY